jgi:hypothetical protein
MARELDPWRQRIRDILLTEWDPTDVSRSPEAWGAYDDDIEPIASLIQSRAPEKAIVDYLFDREHQIMCFPGLGKQRLRRIAQLLIATQ